ncbi:MAG: hypothetical protein JWO05_99 [Gemmatimonadetes bacterium]|nr:hypothetical protein [Gemmatimonadota bacterium]
MSEQPARPGADEWLPTLECLLRGLAHGMGNRVSAVSALADLSSDATGLDEDFSLTDLLRNEGVAMRTMLQSVRMLAPDGRSRPEAFVASEAAADALELLQLHQDWRLWTIDDSGLAAGPAFALRAPRWALVHALLAMTSRAVGMSEPATLRVALEGDDASVTFSVSASPAAACLQGPGEYLEGLMPDLHATLHQEGGTLRLTLPSLAELRRRERA